VNGKPLTSSAKDMANGISTSPDHTTLLKKGSSLFSITQFEEGAGMMYITKLSDTAGVLAAVDTKPVNLSATYGGYTFCAGMPTPWGTHLGGEEYPTDANAFEKAKGIMASFDPYLEFFGFKPTGQ
jgi:secreted PhoX family phosphatase